ncbi:hypothetical protein [Corynebacterium sp. CCM 9204]|uniref:hypothetical protein n=1 Tax=Corynebacterium sp. CCM 9204 TaxID=3057616 RepID=UPI0035233A44
MELEPRTVSLDRAAATDESTWFSALFRASGAGNGTPIPRNLDSLADFLRERTYLRKVICHGLEHWPRERRIGLCTVFLDTGVDLQMK